MNDVNEFMARFGSGFELKWGLATDPELGSKVKVTILATGFGIENVDGMNGHFKKRTMEEQNRIAEEEEKAAERQDRRNRYYGKDGKTSQYKRRPHIFIFRPEDLDNDDVISAVEQTPTYKRTRQILDSIRSQGTGSEEQKEGGEPKEAISGTIKFG
jgi:cell division protein FtsZ